MDIYQTEDEQVEAIKKWWKEYGSTILIGLLIGIVGLFGWRYWDGYKAGQATQASTMYAQMLRDLQLRKYEDVAGAGLKLMENYSKTPYASLAALTLAKIDIENEKYPTARTHLEWVVSNSKQKGVRDIASIRLSRVFLAQGELNQAMEILANVDLKGFSGSLNALKGDIYVAMNDNENARKSYMEALLAPDLSQSNRNLIQLKLDDL